MGLGLVPSIREYRAMFGITQERLDHHKKEIVIMHPGPMNRGVEIDGFVADSDQAIILDQVLNGVASRMAILYLLCGGKSIEKEKS
jgi:aspartate carbamoyltransferase catalytic subunit